MSTVNLCFIDDERETMLTVHGNSSMKSIIIQYLNEINAPLITSDPNVYVFQFGQKVLNSKKNIDKTVEDLGLFDDCDIRMTRKEDRNYALNFLLKINNIN